jgi:hypothetical protein
MAEREDPNREPDSPTEPAGPPPRVEGNMSSASKGAAWNRRATQGKGAASRRTPRTVRQMLRSLWRR